MATLNAGGVLNVNQELRSNNGTYRLLMQTDGNLVLYAGEPSAANAVWATNTWYRQPAMRPTHADMQEGGNFVLYSANGNPVWASGTDRNPNSRLEMQDD